MKNILFKKLLLISALSILFTPVVHAVQQEDQVLYLGQQLYTITVNLTTTEPEKPIKELISSLKNDPVTQDILSKAQEAGLQKYKILAKAYEIAEIRDGQEALSTKTLISACKQDWHYWAEKVKPYATYIAASAVTLLIVGLLTRSYVKRQRPLTIHLTPEALAELANIGNTPNASTPPAGPIPQNPTTPTPSSTGENKPPYVPSSTPPNKPLPALP